MTDWTSAAGYLVTGALAGLTAGMIGVGGGVVTVPFLDVLWTARGADAHQAFAVARGTSLAVMVFTSASAAYGQWRRGMVRLPWALRLAAGGLAGAAVGAYLGTFLDAAVARRVFALLALFIAWRFFRGRARAGDDGDAGPIQRPGLAAPMGALVGAFSSFFGVGGAILSIPLLVRLAGMRIHQAVATSSALIVGLGAAGAISFVLLGLAAGDAPPGCVGYIDPPATALIAATSMVFARAGVALAHRLPPRRIELLFAAYALAIGVKMLAF